MTTFYFVSLGCPKNRVDSEVAVATLVAAGCRPVSAPEDADLIVVNTCSFVAEAAAESIDTLLEMAQFKERDREVRLVAMGCLSQQAAEELARAMPELDLLVGTGGVARLPELLQGGRRIVVEGDKYVPAYAPERVLSQSRSFAYLKVADGCSRKCAFCTIPSIKGPFESRPVNALVEEAKALASMGIKELVLVAQDLTQFGKPGKRRLVALLDELEKVDGVEWIRLLYLYPDGIGPALLRRLSGGGKVVPYLDMPIQHIDDRVLRRMRRGTSEKSIRRTIERVRSACPDVALRTTLIVGHPGEDERAFSKLESFVGETGFDSLGVFRFSPEPGTHASGLPARLQVPEEESTSRRSRIMELQRSISRGKNDGLVGKRLTVLVDGPSTDHEWVLVGRTTAQAPEIDGVVFLDDYEGEPARFVVVEITGAADYDLVGKAVSR